MKLLLVTTAFAAACLASAAMADSFTGTYENGAITMVMMPPSQSAPAQGGAFWKGVATGVYKSGVTTKSTYTCIGWLTPGQPTSNTAVCNAADNATDTWSIQILCAAADINDPSKPATCWGATTGTGGRYAGKTGQFVQHGTTTSGTSEGSWND